MTRTPSRTWCAVAALLLAIGVGCRSTTGPSRSDGALDPTPSEEVVAACRAVLEDQRDAWNAGDLPAFVDGYGGDAVFASVDGVELGHDGLLDRYRRRYPDRAAMGVLDFDELRFADLGDGHVVVRGVWRLEREAGPLGGRFVLVMRPIDGEHRVVLDYTTSDDAVLMGLGEGGA